MALGIVECVQHAKPHWSEYRRQFFNFWPGSGCKEHAPDGHVSQGEFLMRRLLGSLLMIALSVPAGFAQQGQPIPISPQSAPPPPVAQGPDQSARGRIRVAVNLVLIDARVTDRNGKLIRDLKPEQFTILENDKQQKVSSVEYFDASEYDVVQPTERKPLIVKLTGLKPPENVL